MKTIHVIGSGQTAQNYVPKFGEECIGVNYTALSHRLDYLVLIDNPDFFTDKFKVFVSSMDWIKTVYTRTVLWNFIPNYQLIKGLEKTDHYPDLLNPDRVPITCMSAVTATVLAYHLGAKRIILHGIDIGPDCFDYFKLDIIKLDFKRVQQCLIEKGVDLYVSSKQSNLSGILPVIYN